MLALAAAPAFLTSCFLYDDRCGDESRTVIATTRFVEPWDAEAGFAQLSLTEHRTEEPLESMWWVVLSDSLKGHIQEARLVDTGADFAVLVELPPDTGIGDEALRGWLQPYRGPTPFADLFGLVLGGRVALQLSTDIPGREFLRQTLAPDYFRDWDRAHCS